ncbi:MAG: CcoQ/FixQ family Cbb3-type cytochrome c oxidase assembly chaperone [Bacteroidetes bacterium]|nr:CcoQ/FixQ family Cbb3-type cytochrome c oxidase assembly chaperone [Bacteroidota bacterium]
MKFIHYLEKISRVDIYALLSFGIFFLFFLAVLTWVFKTDKNRLNTISHIPLDEQETQN